MSIRYQQSLSLARAITYSATLTADDPRFLQNVEVLHEDGSLWSMRHAFVMCDPADEGYLWLITEHFGEQVFAADEIKTRAYAGALRDYLAREPHDGAYTNPALVQCQCAECNGHFYVDGTNRDKSRAYLACDVCKCICFAPVEKL